MGSSGFLGCLLILLVPSLFALWAPSPLALSPLCSVSLPPLHCLASSADGLVQYTGLIQPSTFAPCSRLFQMSLTVLSLIPMIKTFSNIVVVRSWPEFLHRGFDSSSRKRSRDKTQAIVFVVSFVSTQFILFFISRTVCGTVSQ